LQVCRYPIGQARNYGTCREQFRIHSKHHRGHCTSSGQACNEYSASIKAVIANHLLDHLPDRAGFTTIALGVFQLEPIEAAIRII